MKISCMARFYIISIVYIYIYQFRHITAGESSYHIAILPLGEIGVHELKITDGTKDQIVYVFGSGTDNRGLNPTTEVAIDSLVADGRIILPVPVFNSS